MTIQVMLGSDNEVFPIQMLDALNFSGQAFYFKDFREYNYFIPHTTFKSWKIDAEQKKEISIHPILPLFNWFYFYRTG
jgi:hypothetical protein